MNYLEQLTFVPFQIPLSPINLVDWHLLIVSLIIRVLFVDQNVIMEIGIRCFPQLIELLNIIDIHQFYKDVLYVEAKSFLVEIDVFLEELGFCLLKLLHTLHLFR